MKSFDVGKIPLAALLFQEVASSQGRADLVVRLPHITYVIEIKFKGSPGAALTQIKKRELLGGAREIRSERL